MSKDKGVVHIPHATLGMLRHQVWEMIQAHGADAPCFWTVWDPSTFQSYWQQERESFLDAVKTGDIPDENDHIEERMPPEHMQAVADEMTFRGGIKPHLEWAECHDLFATK